MTCETCGHEIQIGEWPFCGDGKNVHERPAPSKGFEPYYDFNIAEEPVLISNPGDRTKHLKPKWNNDYVEHIQPRDLPASYYRELNERRAERAARSRS